MGGGKGTGVGSSSMEEVKMNSYEVSMENYNKEIHPYLTENAKEYFLNLGNGNAKHTLGNGLVVETSLNSKLNVIVNLHSEDKILENMLEELTK